MSASDDPAHGLAGGSRLVVGLRPVREAIRRHGAALREVLIEDRTTPTFEALARFASDQKVARVRRVSRAELDRLSRGTSHQGAATRAPELVLTPFETLLADPTLLAVALDSISDPQNFGAVLRSSVALGGAAVLFAEHGAAPLTPATFRASAGAVEHVRLCRVRSLSAALARAVEVGVAVVGLDPESKLPLASLDLRPATVLVLGSEGSGLARSTRRACTATAALGSLNTLGSLNASVAAGIALYEAMNQRLKSNS